MMLLHLWVLLGPCPLVSAHLCEAQLCLPAQLLLSILSGSPHSNGVTRAAVNNLIGHLKHLRQHSNGSCTGHGHADARH